VRGWEESVMGRPRRVATNMRGKRGWKGRVSDVEIGCRVKGYGCREGG